MNSSIEQTSLDPIVILGAGPSGLACAHSILSRSKRKVILIDKASTVGGMGASFHWKEYTLDFGPHTFHKRGNEPEKLIKKLFIQNPEDLIEGKKNVHVYLKNRRFRYPLQVGETLLKFNPLLSIKIIMEFMFTSLVHFIVSVPIDNFENWGCKRFGKTLYRMSFGDYTRKVWKVDPTKISEKFASEKIQGFSFINLIKRLLRIGGQVTEPYFQEWIYHRKGCGYLFEKFADSISNKGGEILLDAKISCIRFKENKAISLQFEQNGKHFEIPCSYLVNTIPLPNLITYFDYKVPFFVKHAASKLKYTSLILVCVEFRQDRICDDHWFYLLEKRYFSNRVCEQKNLNPNCWNPGKTILMFEITCLYGDDVWQMSDQDLLKIVKKDCSQISFINPNQIIDFTVQRIPQAYELYLKGFDQCVEIVLFFLSTFVNLTTIGRRGLFLQGDMHQAVEIGIETGKILSKSHFDQTSISHLQQKYLKFLQL